MGGCGRVDTGEKQGFIRVDVTQPGNEGLIKQQRFDLAFASVEFAIETLRGQLFIKGFLSQPAKNGLRIIHQPDTAKLSSIVKYQTTGI